MFLLRPFAGAIVALVWVISQIVQFDLARIEEFDELPILCSDSAGGPAPQKMRLV